MSAIQTKQWKKITGKPSDLHQESSLSLAAEILIEHHHFDQSSNLDWSAGIMINRHLRSDLTIPTPNLITCDTPGIDEDPTNGCAISLASGNDPRLPSLRGLLESLDYDCANLSRHQLDWLFLKHHVQIAYNRFHSNDATTRSCTENMRLELSDFQKADALAIHANSFGLRGEIGPSCHGVDVLCSTHHCSGMSMSLLMLAHVAGLEARLINTINHSTVEIKINGRWLWSDNIAGNRALILASYQEMLINPEYVVSMTPLSLKYHSDAVPHYRSPYNFSANWQWKSCGWLPKNATSDINNGLGYSMPYDPTTAEALYPGARHHFQVPITERPMLNLSKLGGWIYAEVDCSNGASLRKVFELSDCKDNPIGGGIARFLIGESSDAENMTVTLDGKVIPFTGNISHLEHFKAYEYDMPAAALTPGQHELIITATSGSLLVYPDMLANSPAPALNQKININHQAFRENKISKTHQF